MVHGGMKCVKYLLFIFDFILLLVGLLVLALGLWLRFKADIVCLLHMDDAPMTFSFGVYILIGTGVLMMLVGFFGCCGVVRESKCLLGLFFACLLIILGAEIAGGVFGYLNKEPIIRELQDFYDMSVEKKANCAVLFYQRLLNCCQGGASDPALCPEAATDNTLKDCKTAIPDFINNKLFMIGYYVGIWIAGAMIIGMVFSMVLCYMIRNSGDVLA